MAANYRPVEGAQINRDELSISRAKDFALLIESGASAHVEVIECHRSDHDSEIVVIELKPTVPQKRTVAIRRTERVSIEFRADDSRFPDVRALREDFPRERVLHLNGGTPQGEPPSLCLFAESWPDVRLRLTANALLHRVQNWFNDTANGSLHRPDQPLEPAFLAKPTPLILSSSIEELMTPGFKLNLGYIKSPAGELFMQRRGDRFYDNATQSPLLIPIIAPEHEHNVVNDPPRNLQELHQQLQPLGMDLIREVQLSLVTNTNQLDKYGFLILLVFLPRKRSNDAPLEVELAAFLCVGSHSQTPGLTGFLRQIGISNSPSEQIKNGSSIQVIYLKVHHELTGESASLYSGNERLNSSLLGIGVGALGSQVVLNAVRGGLSQWTIIDDDLLLPHNLARHALSGHWVGCAKVDAVADTANSLLAKPNVKGENFNVFAEPAKLNAAAANAEAIVDLSASVAVARQITCDVEAAAPRCSAFVCPSGNDLVFLGESRERSLKLDSIEAQYYRAIAADERLAGHLQGGSMFGSCRNVTSQVSQDLIGIHACQTVRYLRRWLTTGNSVATILRVSDATGAIQCVEIELSDTVEVGTLGEWKVKTDAGFLATLDTLRAENLPNETGGVLLAHVDAQRKTLYVCHQIPAPPDSEKQPVVYIRGSAGLAAEYKRIREATLNGLAYIGEWHSHPDNSPCSPSEEDLRAGVWLAEETQPTSLPGLMLIVGERKQTCWMLCTQSPEQNAPCHLFLTQGKNNE